MSVCLSGFISSSHLPKTIVRLEFYHCINCAFMSSKKKRKPVDEDDIERDSDSDSSEGEGGEGNGEVRFKRIKVSLKIVHGSHVDELFKELKAQKDRNLLASTLCMEAASQRMFSGEEAEAAEAAEDQAILDEFLATGRDPSSRRKKKSVVTKKRTTPSKEPPLSSSRRR